MLGDQLDTQDIFSVAMMASLELGSKPVVCHDLLPELSMLIVAQPIPIDGPSERQCYIELAWKTVAAALTQRQGCIAADQRATVATGTGVITEFVRTDGIYTLSPGAMRIQVQYGSALLARFHATRQHSPLIAHAAHVRASSPLDDPLFRGHAAPHSAQLAGLIRDALVRTEWSADDRYARLPLPIRFRASGALTAWAQVRQAAGAVGAAFTRQLREDPVGLMRSDFSVDLETWAGHTSAMFATEHDRHRAHGSVPWQAFDVSHGALYEPTPPLHRLLDDAYVADDVPVGMIELPVDTLCIIPDPSWWGHRGGLDAIMLFRRRSEIAGDQPTGDVINIVAWTDVRDENWLETGLIQIPLDDSQKTIKQFVEDWRNDMTQGHVDADTIAEALEHWHRVLDYTIKLLLYLATGDAQVVHDRAYTNAPRNFGGLGKRKRTERLAQIEMLYDRHIVGPAILNAEIAGATSSDGRHHEVRGHWRRPHFRMQPHGPQASLRKVVFIGPTIVRPDRLGL
ncbi:hypothetical protein [Burkholderia pseudomallei]|nr:hypothetical protein [Burkholderia pseudomallei]